MLSMLKSTAPAQLFFWVATGSALLDVAFGMTTKEQLQSSIRIIYTRAAGFVHLWQRPTCQRGIEVPIFHHHNRDNETRRIK